MKKLTPLLCALCALLLAGCSGVLALADPSEPQSPTKAPLQPTSQVEPVDSPSPAPTLAAHAASPAPALPLAERAASPAPAPPTPDPRAPPRVGLQVGHWKIEDHADEMARLRRFSGTYYGGFDEWELNIMIAEAARVRLEAAGVVVDLLPARVPMGYQADAFVSVHLDGVTGEEAATRRGWKVAAPFRASEASEGLAAAISAAYPTVTDMPADREEHSYNLRAYYAFAYYRYWHSIAPTTPAAIIECGFMTHPADRRLILDQPELLAEGIAQGVLGYLATYHPLSAESRAPVGAGMLRPLAAGVALYERPSATSSALMQLTQEDRLVPVDEAEGWSLVFVRGGDWELGWVRAAEVTETGEPLEPPHPRPAKR